MDFGPHTPYIAAAYAVSIITIALLVVWRARALKSAQADERKGPLL